MKTSKTELHALHSAPSISIKTDSGAQLSTHSLQGTLHADYKYLGVYLFTSPNPLLWCALLGSELQIRFCSECKYDGRQILCSETIVQGAHEE